MHFPELNGYLSDIDSVHEVIALLNRFGKAAESKLNVNKTCILLCGSLKGYKITAGILNFTEDKLENFKFFLLTKLSQPSEVLLDKFHSFRVHIPGADAFADID